MDAFFARNRLSAYLDGELTVAEARDVESALARDPELRAELEALREAIELLREQGIVEPPAGFAQRLSARLDDEAMPVGWRRWTRQMRPEGAMLAAAALLVVLYVGNHDALPDLELPEEGGVVAARTFDKGSEDAQTAAPEPEPEPSTVVSGNGKEADGVLGNEPQRAPTVAPKPAAAASPGKVVTRSPKSALDVEPWQASWEKEGSQPNSPPSGATQFDDNTGVSGADNTATVQWSSPPPFRYRVTASSDMAMKQLASIATELGGSLQDSRGRPLAAYQLDDGEARSIRVSVPAHNAARLAERLRELGIVETIKEPGNLLADPNTDVGVQVELRN